MISELEARGGSQYLSISGDKNLFGRTLVRVIRATTTGLLVFLPRATIFNQLGWPAQVIINTGLNNFTVVDFAGNTMGILGLQRAFVFALTNNQTAAGSWSMVEYILSGHAVA